MGKPAKAIPGDTKAYLRMIEVPYRISPEENNERIKRLSREIWDCILAGQGKKRANKNDVGEILNEGFETKLGL